MAGEKSVRLSILGDNADAKAKFAEIDTKAEELKQLHPELSIGINMAAASEKIRIFKAEIRAAAEAEPVDIPVEFTADDARAVTAMDVLKAKIDALKAQRATITFDANDKAAVASMAAFDAQLDALSLKSADPSVAINGMPKALADVAALDLALDKIKSKDKVTFKDIDFAPLASGALWAAAFSAAAGPLPVILGGVAAGVLGVGSALVAGGVGLGVFGAVVKGTFTQYATQIAAVSKAQTDFENGVRGSQMASEFKAMDTAVKGLSPDVQDLVFSAGNAEASWHKFITNSANGVDKVLGPALDLVPKLLSEAGKFLPPVEAALSSIVSKISTGLNSTGFQSFISSLSSEAGPSITKLADIIGHLGSMVGKTVVAFAPLGGKVLDDINNLLGKADAGTNSGIQKFLNWLSVNGPQVMGILKNLGSTVLNMAKAFGSLGGLNIQAWSVIAGFIAKIASHPIGADALVGLLVLLKVGQMAGPIVKLAMALKDLEIAELLATAGAWALDAVPLIALIVLIGLAVAALVVGIIELVKHWSTVWHAISAATDVAVKAVTGFFKQLGHDAAAIWDSITSGVSTAFHKVTGFLTNLKDTITGNIGNALNWVKTHWKEIVAWLVDPIGMAIHEIITHTKQISQAFDTARHAVAAVLAGARHDISSAFDGVRHDIAAFADWVPKTINSLWDSARHKAASLLAGMRADISKDFDAIRHDIAATVDAIPGDIAKAWATVLRDAQTLGTNVLHAMETAWSNVTSATSKGVSNVLSFFEKLPGQIVSFLAALPGKMLSIGENIVMGILHGVENQASTLLNTVKNLAGDVVKAFTDPLAIFSPSRVFMQHGANVVMGAVVGVQQAAPKLRAAMSSLGRTTASAGLGATNSLVSVVAGSGSSSASTQLEWTGGQGDQEFMTFIKKNIRKRGGDPAVMGR